MTLLSAALACGCNEFDTKRPTESASKTDAERFQMLQFERTLANGIKTPTALRIDSSTGETWILDLQNESTKWVSVSDNLRTVGTTTKRQNK
jgi:hypothetical protein